MNDKVSIIVKEVLNKVFRLPEKLSIIEWCQKYIVLSAMTSGHAGKYQIKKTPYLQAVYNDIENPRIRQVTMLKSAQIGATTLANNIILWYVANRNVPILYATSTNDMARAFSERSLHPSVQLCKPVQPLRTQDIDDERRQQINFTNCIVRLSSGSSVSSLASNPICVLIADELSKWDNDKNEAQSIDLARARLISYPYDSKMLVMSTPIEENVCPTYKEYKKGSQTQIHIQCPSCKNHFHPTIDLLNAPDNAKNEHGDYDHDLIKKNTRIRCQHCQTLHSENKKRQMVENHITVDTNTECDKEHRSYLINSLVSYDVSWGHLLSLYIQSKDDLDARKYLHTNYLATPWKHVAATIKTELIDGIIDKSPKYFLKSLPEEPLILIGSIDTQKDHYYYSVYGLLKNDRMCLVDYGMAQTSQDLDTVISKTYNYNNKEHSVYKYVIDQGGNRTNEVQEYALKNANKIICCVGRNERNGLYAPVRESQITVAGVSLPLLLINDVYHKQICYLRWIKQNTGELLLPQDTSDEYKTGITAERLEEKSQKNGLTRFEWVSGRNNHYGDCLIYATALSLLLRPIITQQQVDKS